jgi:hypothetical protein
MFVLGLYTHFHFLFYFCLLKTIITSKLKVKYYWSPISLKAEPFKLKETFLFPLIEKKLKKN